MFKPPKTEFDAEVAPMARKVPRDPEAYPAFDWLRIILASGVFWVHAGSVAHFNFAGDLFVQIFFALSGFLIGGIILRMDRSDLPRFFYNRAVRIWVPFFAAVGFVYGAAILKEGFSAYYWQSLVYDLTFTHNYFIEKTPEVIAALPMHGTGTHFWSISVEEQFYLMAPLVILFVPFAKYWQSWVVIALFGMTVGHWYGSVSMGVLAVMLQHRFGNWHTRPWAVVMLASLGVGLCLLWAFGPFEYRYLVPFLSVTVVLLCARPGRRTRLGTWVGGISFPMYLHHWTGLFVANAVANRAPGLGVLNADLFGFALALAVAAFAYTLIDQRLHARRAAYYTPALGRIAMATAYGLMALGFLLGLQVIGPLAGPPGRV